jgi:hypothetical protein
MQISTVRDHTATPQAHHNGAVSFFEAHPIGEIIRGLFLSSVLWVLLAIAVYMVYSMVLGVS